ncbi:MAG: VWA domain-containing protein [Alphaproteobacteria bacterium]|nr:VWA domain-containing protein [Alphaproteobacteria bacterium]
MTFLWPPAFWFLLVLPLLALAYWRGAGKRGRVLARYPALLAASQVRGWKGAIRRHLPPLLLLVSFALLVVAFARPAATITLASQRGTLILAMDVSGSMRADDVRPTRMTAAQLAAMEFVKERPRQVKIGLVAFSGGAFLVQAPTDDNLELNAAIEQLRPERMTAIGSAVLTSMQTLFPDQHFDTMLPGFGGDQFYLGTPIENARKPKAEKPKLPKPVEPGSYKSAAIILMTDGKSTLGPDPVEAARIASNYGVRVYTIGFGTPNGQISLWGDRVMKVQLDEETLKQMAKITNAQYFHAKTQKELSNIYRQLNTKLQAETTLEEISAFFVAGAALFAALSVFLSLAWHGRVI